MGSRRPLLLVLLCVLAATHGLHAAACQPARLTAREQPRGQILRVNLGPGVGYASLLLMQKRRLLERRVPGLVVEWKSIPTAEGIDEALAAGSLDIAHGSLAQFLLARERGLPVRVLAGVAELPTAVMSRRSGVRSLRDLDLTDRVALPQPEGHEHTLLRMAAMRELGDWRALDRLVVPRPHSEAFTALISRREITAHVAIPPYLDRELELPELHRLVDGEEVMGGPTTAVVAYTTPALRERQGALFAVFLDALRESADLARADPAETARMLAENEQIPVRTERLVRSLANPAVAFSMRVRGLPRLVTFMQYTDQIGPAPISWRDLTFDEVEGG